MLPSYDGQAGAAAITLEDRSFETAFIEALCFRLRKTGLPAYALPRLVRIVPEMVTGFTFKQAKSEYQKRKWNPSQGEEGDSLYWLDGKRYRKLERQDWHSIEIGMAKL
jgi:hypothetical protein